MKRKTKSKYVEKSKNTKTLRMLVVALSFVLLTVILVLIAKNFPKFTNGAYSKFSISAMDFLSRTFSFAAFSIAEILIYIIALGFLISFIIFIKNLIKQKNRFSRIFHYLTALLLIASIGVFLFYSLWGCMYYSDGLMGSMDYSVKERSVEELVTMNKYLIEKANSLSVLVARNEQGYYTGYEFGRYADLTAKAVSSFTKKPEALPKYVIASIPWSYTQTTGIFTFITGEANINNNNLAISLPFTCAHEMAHRNGITSEDEANFFAFYTLVNFDNVNLTYSAYSMTLMYTMNSLYSKDVEAYRQLAATYSKQLRQDYDRYSEHWDRYEGKVSEFSSKTNDAYLKAQGQTDGVQSYGRVTDIMLAWYEQEVTVK